jgi:hypothetical protein
VLPPCPLRITIFRTPWRSTLATTSVTKSINVRGRKLIAHGHCCTFSLQLNGIVGSRTQRAPRPFASATARSANLCTWNVSVPYTRCCACGSVDPMGKTATSTFRSSISGRRRCSSRASIMLGYLQCQVGAPFAMRGRRPSVRSRLTACRPPN